MPTLSIDYQPLEDCERVIVRCEHELPRRIFFEDNEQLWESLLLSDLPFEVCERAYLMTLVRRLADEEIYPRVECARSCEERPPAAGKAMDASREVFLGAVKFVCASVLLAGLGLFWIVGAGMAWRAWR